MQLGGLASQKEVTMMGGRKGSHHVPCVLRNQEQKKDQFFLGSDTTAGAMYPGAIHTLTSPPRLFRQLGICAYPHWEHKGNMQLGRADERPSEHCV